jgi:hypothetical protein
MSRHKRNRQSKGPIGKTREQDVALWDDLPTTGDLLTDITIFLCADMGCGPNSLRRQLLTRERP